MAPYEGTFSGWKDTMDPDEYVPQPLYEQLQRLNRRRNRRQATRQAQNLLGFFIAYVGVSAILSLALSLQGHATFAACFTGFLIILGVGAMTRVAYLVWEARTIASLKGRIKSQQERHRRIQARRDQINNDQNVTPSVTTYIGDPEIDAALTRLDAWISEHPGKPPPISEIWH